MNLDTPFCLWRRGAEAWASSPTLSFLSCLRQHEEVVTGSERSLSSFSSPRPFHTSLPVTVGFLIVGCTLDCSILYRLVFAAGSANGGVGFLS